MPRSIPTAPPLWVGTSCSTSTAMETNHQPARQEMTALMIFPSNRRASVILCLEVFDLGPCALGTAVFPASKRPVIGMTGNPTGFAKIHLLFGSWMKPDDMRTLHVRNLLSPLCAGQHLAFPALSEDEPVLAVQADQSSPPCFHGIRPRPI